MTGKTSRLTISQIIASVVIGACIEAGLIAIIAAYPPDPPMSFYNFIMLMSQAFGIAAGGLIVSPFVNGMTNTQTLVTLFCFQVIFYISVSMLGFYLWNKKQLKGPSNGSERLHP